MDFSKMQHRITFLKPAGTYKNGMGENVPEYTEHMTVWAYVAPKTGREYEEAQKLRAETTYNVLTRYFPGISTDMRILFRGRTFLIESVLNVEERNEQLQIVAVEKDKNGVET